MNIFLLVEEICLTCSEDEKRSLIKSNSGMWSGVPSNPKILELQNAMNVRTFMRKPLRLSIN